MSHSDFSWFWDGFEEIADAPGGVARLRELILSLAVQGRLVPQNDSDEPASVLLERIAEEKARLMKEGKIRKSSPLAPVGEGEAPFELPGSWAWVRLGEVATYIQRGKSPKYTLKSDFPVISQKCVRWDGVDWAHIKFIEPESLNFYGEERFLGESDLLWNSTGTGTVGRICVFKPDARFSQVVADSHVTVVRVSSLDVRYVWIYLAAPFTQNKIEGMTSGSTNQVELNLVTVVKHPFPLPPLAEQKRIVAKVDELMALCDELETRQKEKRAGRVVALNACLHRLGQAADADADEFETRLETLADHFEELLDAPECVAPRRAAILGLAVQGQLEAQNPDDEPASVLLERIAHEKAELIAQKKIRKSDPLPPIDAETVPFEIPASWEWVRLGEVATYIQRGKSPNYMIMSDFPIISQKCVQWSGVSFEHAKYIEPESVNNYGDDRFLSEGDLLWNSTGTGTVGRIGIFQTDARFAKVVADSHVTVVRMPSLDVRYAWIFLAGPFTQSKIESMTSGSTNQVELNLATVIKHPVPIPPLAEQKRIVARVDGLMALCDELEAILQARQTDGAVLVGATVRAVGSERVAPACISP